VSSENTHIWFANSMIGSYDDRIMKVLKDNLDQYFFGSVFPDLFFYAKDRAIFYAIHGKTAKSNAFIFEYLDLADNDGDLAFILGHLTHYAMDCTLHPKLAKITKIYKDEAYAHWHIETLIDINIENGLYVDRMIDPFVIKKLKLGKVLRFPASQLIELSKKQNKDIGMFRNPYYYHMYKLLANMNLVDKTFIAGFFENEKYESIPYPDLDMDKIQKDAAELHMELADAAVKYYQKEMTKNECSKVISSRNFDSGKV